MSQLWFTLAEMDERYAEVAKNPNDSSIHIYAFDQYFLFASHCHRQRHKPKTRYALIALYGTGLWVCEKCLRLRYPEYLPSSERTDEAMIKANRINLKIAIREENLRKGKETAVEMLPIVLILVGLAFFLLAETLK